MRTQLKNQYVILDSDGDYVLLVDSKYAPERFIVAYGIDEEDESWKMGLYFRNLENALECFKNKVEALGDAYEALLKDLTDEETD